MRKCIRISLQKSRWVYERTTLKYNVQLFIRVSYGYPFFFFLKMVFKKKLKQSASAFKAKHCGFKRFSWSTKKLSTARSLSAQLRCNLIKTSIIQGYGCAKPFYQHSHQRYYWLLLFFSVAFSICIYSSQWLKKKSLLTTCMQHLAICCWRVAFTFFSFAAVVFFKQSVHHGNNTV